MNWNSSIASENALFPKLKTKNTGNTRGRVSYCTHSIWRDGIRKTSIVSIPSAIGHTLVDQTSREKEYGVDIVSLDCDGLINTLIPTWIENGVNTMFPIVAGTGMPASHPGEKNTDKNCGAWLV